MTTAAKDSSTPPASLAATGAALGDFSGRELKLDAVVANAAPEMMQRRMAEAAAAPRNQAAAVPRQSVASAMIIRNGSVTIQVDSIEVAVERVRRLATSLGGYVGGMNMSTGAHQVRSATLELRVPANRFDTVMTGMPALGKVEHSSTSSEDVGEEFVDIEARTANAKRLESRLVQILATKTGKLADVLAVERELARVRQEIERHEGRMRFLAARVATSTIHATVHEKMPVIAEAPGQNVLAIAFLNMWRNFVRLLTATIEAMGVLLPVALLAWGIFVAWKRWYRRPTGGVEPAATT